MKKTIIIAATLIMTACTEQPHSATTVEEVSWAAFCAARGYDRNDTTSDVTNEYLDTWCGSMEEDKAINN